MTRALIVDFPWVDLILDEGKDWEMRSARTNVRGPVGIIASGTGEVRGVADIVDCLAPMGAAELAAHGRRHRLPADKLSRGDFAKWNIPWVLDGARRLAEPVKYRHPRGAVIWVTLDPDTAIAVSRLAGLL